MKTPHIITNSSIVAIIDGKNLSATSGTSKYNRVLDAINADDDDAFVTAMASTESESKVKEMSESGFEIIDGVVQLDGVKVIGPLEQKLSRMIREGHNTDHFVAFLRNLRRNPSYSSVKELYDFLSYAELPLTEDGKILAYKGLQEDYYSVSAGDMTLKQGRVSRGYVYNGVGEVIECERVNVDDDRRNSCSNGLHVGSFRYAKDFGPITVMVEVDPADVVSVPLDCECQKMRVSAYRVIGDECGEVTDAVVDSDGQTIESEKSKWVKKVAKKVSSLSGLDKRVTIKRIQSALSPECLPLFTIRDILVNDLGYYVSLDPDHPTSVGHMEIS